MPADMPARAAHWVVVFDSYEPMPVVSEPRPARPACFGALWTALAEFSYRTEDSAIYFSFRDANYAHASARSFQVWLAHVNGGDVSWMGGLAAELVDDGGGYEAVYVGDWTRLYYSDAWCVVQDFGRGTPPEQRELQPLDLDSLD